MLRLPVQEADNTVHMKPCAIEVEEDVVEYHWSAYTQSPIQGHVAEGKSANVVQVEAKYTFEISIGECLEA